MTDDDTPNLERYEMANAAKVLLGDGGKAGIDVLSAIHEQHNIFGMQDNPFVIDGITSSANSIARGQGLGAAAYDAMELYAGKAKEEMNKATVQQAMDYFGSRGCSSDVLPEAAKGIVAEYKDTKIADLDPENATAKLLFSLVDTLQRDIAKTNIIPGIVRKNTIGNLEAKFNPQ
jgi:hypothetical protein